MGTTSNAPEKGERSAEYIIDHGIALSDCTEEELARVIDYRANIKSRDAAYQAIVDNAKAANEQAIADSKAICDTMAANFEKLCAPFIPEAIPQEEEDHEQEEE